MNRMLQLILLLCCACGASAQSVQFVVPNGLANVEGNSSSGGLFVNGTARMLQVYSATEFDFIDAPSLRIDAVAFRLEGGTGPIVASYLINVGISTTARSPDALSPVFDENGGPDAITVRTGTFGILATDTTMSPRPFEVRIALARPFFYDPSQGNLALSIVASGTRDIQLDGHIAGGDSVGRVYGPNALSGTVDTLGLVTRFEITPIPEPSVFGLGLLGVLLLGLQSRSRRTQ